MAYKILFVFFFFPIALLAEDLVFAEDSEWEVVTTGHQFAEGMAWDKEGHLYFTDVPRKQLFKVDKDTGEVTLIDDNTGNANGIAFGPDGRLYGCCSGDNSINAWDPETWTKTAVNSGTPSNDIAILNNGTIFYTDPRSSKVWRLEAGSFERSEAATLPWRPNGITLSLDQKTLLVAEFNSDTIHGFPIGEDSRLTGSSHPAYKLAMPSDQLGRLDGMMVLDDGRLLSGTQLGTQIVPPVFAASASGPHIVIPSPEGRPRCNYARISPDKKWMYTAYGKDILRRRIRQ
ncbi:MAG: SMP-30/gluconolactonase/LRE family protein [Puniceicoccaceae bacterium]